MNAGIYQIKNVINGNAYIGQSVELNRRSHDHFQRLKNNKHENGHLQNAFKKYGKENFVFDILLYCEPFELTRYEQKIVDILEPQYNICKECVDSPKGIKRTEESKLKMSLAANGRKHTEETKRKISLANKGRKVSEEGRYNMSVARTGHVMSEEKKQKISKSLTGRKHSEETKQKMSLARNKRIISEETRKKLSLAQKAVWQRKKQEINELLDRIEIMC